MDFLQKLLKKEVKPAPDVSPLLDKVKQKFKERKIKVDVMLGGSLAKNTYLAAHDIDIFVQFYDKPDSSLLEEVLLSITKKVKRIHGSRDYFHVRYKGIDFEIVPILKIKKPCEAENTPDVSPFHVTWVKKHLKKPDEVRLAKLFCQGQGVYGAESYIQGFSGYVLEILLVHYKTFIKFVEAAAQWQPDMIIDVAKHFKSESQVLKTINESKLDSPLILVDPTDKHRNAVAALSTEKWLKFIDACRTFLQNPSEDFFKERGFQKQALLRLCRKHKTTPYILSFEELAHREDISFSKVRKCYSYLKKVLKNNDFDLYSTGIDWKKRLMWFECPEPLHPVKKVNGPLLWSQKKNIVEFQMKYEEWDIEGTRYIAFQKRKYTKAKQLLKATFREVYIKEKVKKIKFT